jgi:hypothetical protein
MDELDKLSLKHYQSSSLERSKEAPCNKNNAWTKAYIKEYIENRTDPKFHIEQNIAASNLDTKLLVAPPIESYTART